MAQKVEICPTITAVSKAEYTKQLDTLVKFAGRIHFDVSDGTLAPRELLGIGNMRWDKKIRADIHVMSRHPHAEVAIATELKPHLVILHAEAATNLAKAAEELHAHGIKAGLALLPSSHVANYRDLIFTHFDHVMIFSGNLGYQGGASADLSLLPKAAELREIKPNLEIGWDGGINDTNAIRLAQAGVSVLNVGSHIARAKSPKAAYAKLLKSITDAGTRDAPKTHS